MTDDTLAARLRKMLARCRVGKAQHARALTSWIVLAEDYVTALPPKRRAK